MTSRTLCLTLGLVAASTGLSAETHRYVPKVFYDTLSAAHPAALRIKSGDRVVTSTVDRFGADASGQVVTTVNDGNTGPFFIEGAEPGDLLVVTLDKLTPNRATGTSTAVVASNALGSETLASNKATKPVPWIIDAAKNVVRLDLSAAIPNVNWQGRYASAVLEMPLRPMLSSIGVAPGGKEAEGPGAGAFGGSLNYGGIAAGTKVMLQVAQPGGLLFLGRGHARQGDGEITGAIETSLDVEFSVEVVKKKEWPHSSVIRPSTVVGEFAQFWPRLETSEHIMAVGSASALLPALQNATVELHHWLDDDYGFSELATSMFLGPAIEYEIANVGDDTFTVVAKVRKAYLPTPASAAK